MAAEANIEVQWAEDEDISPQSFCFCETDGDQQFTTSGAFPQDQNAVKKLTNMVLDEMETMPCAPGQSRKVEVDIVDEERGAIEISPKRRETISQKLRRKMSKRRSKKQLPADTAVDPVPGSKNEQPTDDNVVAADPVPDNSSAAQSSEMAVSSNFMCFAREQEVANKADVESPTDEPANLSTNIVSMLNRDVNNPSNQTSSNIQQQDTTNGVNDEQPDVKPTQIKPPRLNLSLSPQKPRRHAKAVQETKINHNAGKIIGSPKANNKISHDNHVSKTTEDKAISRRGKCTQNGKSTSNSCQVKKSKQPNKLQVSMTKAQKRNPAHMKMKKDNRNDFEDGCKNINEFDLRDIPEPPEEYENDHQNHHYQKGMKMREFVVIIWFVV